MIHIYIIVDPRDSRIFYVGQTQDPKVRWAMHLSEAIHHARGIISRKNERFTEIFSVFQMPLFVTIEVVSERIADAREVYWYDLLKEAGADLVNGSRPGAAHRKGNRRPPNWRA